MNRMKCIAMGAQITNVCLTKTLFGNDFVASSAYSSNSFQRWYKYESDISSCLICQCLANCIGWYLINYDQDLASFAMNHDDVIRWKHFPRFWPFVRGIHLSQRTVTRSFDVFFDLRLNKRLREQSWGRWFETPSCSLWRHCNVNKRIRDTNLFTNVPADVLKQNL